MKNNMSANLSYFGLLKKAEELPSGSDLTISSFTAKALSKNHEGLDYCYILEKRLADMNIKLKIE